jgi:signal transduction histidine kinase
MCMSVEPDEQIARVFAQRDRTAPRAARDVVANMVDIGDGVRCDLTLVVSELVANAVRHAPSAAAGEIELVIARQDGHIHVEVSDPGCGFDPTPHPTREGGLGLVTVSRVALDWGIRAGERTIVWCNLDAG